MALQQSEFHWLPVSGNWSSLSNWVVLNNGTFNASVRLPNSLDSIYFDQPGNYSVRLDLNLYSFLNISIGNLQSTAYPTLVVNLGIINFNSTTLYPSGTLFITNSTLNFYSPVILNGNWVMNNFTTLNFFQSALIGGILSYSPSTIFNFFNFVTFQNILVVASSFNFLFDITLTGSSVFQLQNSFFQNNIFLYGNSSLAILGINTISSNITLFTNGGFSGKGILNMNGAFFGNSTFQVDAAMNFNGSTIVNRGICSFLQPVVFFTPLYFSSSSQVIFNNVTTISQPLYGNGTLTFGVNSVTNWLVSGLVNATVQSSSTINFVSTTLTFVNSVTKSQSSQFNIQSSSSITIASTLDIAASLNSFSGTGSLIIALTGQINWNSGVSNLLIPINLNSLMTFKNGDFSFSSSFNLNPGSTLYLYPNSNVRMNNQLNLYPNSTLFTSPNAAIHVYGLAVISNCNMSGNGSIIFESTSSTTFSGVSTNIFSQVFSNSLITFTSGLYYFKNYVSLSQTSQLNLQGFSTVEFDSQSDIYATQFSFNGNGFLLNAGTMNWIGGTMALTLQIDSNSVMTFSNGYYIFSNSLNLNGNSTTTVYTSGSVRSDAVCTLKSTINGNGTFIVGSRSTLNWNQGLIDTVSLVVQTKGTLNWNLGTLINSASIQITGVLNIFSTPNPKTISNTILTINGVVTLSPNVINMISSKIIVSATGIMNHLAGGNIYNQNSEIINNGNYLVLTQNPSPITLLTKFTNNNYLSITGSGICSLTNNFFQGINGIFNQSSNLFISGTLLIDNGEIVIGGNITANLINITSSSGILLIPGNLNVYGDFFISYKTTFIFSLKGNKAVSLIAVSGLFTLNSLTYLKLENGYIPEIGDSIKFATFNTSALVSNFILLGVSFRTGSLTLKNKFATLDIIASVGSAQDANYRCTYLGNQKIVEYQILDDNDKVAISFTTPKSNGWIGFGFDTGSKNISDSILIVFSKGQVFQMINHTLYSPLPNNIIDIGSSSSQSIFKIGKEYQSINVFLKKGVITNQSVIFFAENPKQKVNINGTKNNILKHYYTQKYFFKLLTQPQIDCTNFLAPSRAEIFSTEATGVLLSFYIIMFVLCVLFANAQPLKSRGISPFLTLAFLFIQLLIEVRNYFYITPFQGSLCFYYAFGYYPLMEICFIMIFLYFLRYFSIINIKESTTKSYAHDLKTGVFNKITLKIKFLKIIAKTWFIVSLLIISLVTMLAIYFFVLVSTNFICTFNTLVIIKTIHNVALIIIYFLTIVVIVQDVILNYKLTLKCHWITYIFEKDPYFFRFQIFMFVPFMVYNIISELVTFATTLNYYGVITNFRTTIIFNTTTFTLLLAIDVVIPLVITIFLYIIKCCRRIQKIHPGSISKIFEDPVLSEAFIKLAKVEFSYENVLAYLDIVDFKNKKITDPTIIYEKYFSGSSAVYETNVPSSKCAEVLAKIRKGDYDLSLFDKLEKEIQTNLHDTNSRFLNSTVYTNYKANKNLLVELIEGK